MSDGDESAFPTTRLEPDHNYQLTRPVYTSGLTKREYFAALAMQGLLSQEGVIEFNGPAGFATLAVCVADALLAELAKPKEKP